MNFGRTKQNLNRAEFLDELRRECALHFEPAVATAVVIEVDAHICESIQARIELGDSPEEAEINAVRAFHKPRKFVRAMGQIHGDGADHDAPLLIIGLTFLCWVAFYIEIAPKHLGWIVGPLGVLCLGSLIPVRSAQLGAVRMGTLRRLAIGTVVVVGLISPLRTVNLWAYGGKGYMPTQMARALISDLDGFIRSTVDGGDADRAYVRNVSEMTREDLEPAKRALEASLWERYTTNASQTMPNLILSFGLIFVFHLLPVSIRRRLNQRRTARRGTPA